MPRGNVGYIGEGVDAERVHRIHRSETRGTIAYLAHDIRAYGWTSLSELLLMLMTWSLTNKATQRLRAQSFNTIHTIAAIAEVYVHASLHP